VSASATADWSAGHWVHDLDPVIFRITDTLAVRWYGLAYVAGFLVAFGLLHLYWKRGRSPLGPQAQEELAMSMIIGVVIGGRLGYFLLYEFSRFMANPLIFFKVWEGGMSSHGGFAGVALATLWLARRRKIHPFEISDLIGTVAAAGLFFGRIANFINGELWGKVSDVPWAVIFPQSAPPGMPVELIAPRHPSQLYAALLEGLLLFLYMQWRFWGRRGGRGGGLSHDPPAPRKTGMLTGEFMVFYSIARALGEQFREPDAGLIAGLSRGTFYSIFLLGAGVGVIIWSSRQRLTNRKSG
jgi:phosphatidylglycerol---prolipoprotein diacylglyceryl transferase